MNHYNILENFDENNQVGLNNSINKITISTSDSLYAIASHILINKICSSKTYNNAHKNIYSIFCVHTIIITQTHFIKKNILSSWCIDQLERIIYEEIKRSIILIIIVNDFIKFIFIQIVSTICEFSDIALNIFQIKLFLNK